MRRSTYISFVAAIAVVAVVACLVATSRDGTASAASGIPSLNKLSSTGAPVNASSITGSEQTTLGQAGVASGVRQLAERSGIRFYLGKSESTGSPCYLTGLARDAAPHFGVLTCPSEFPSDEEPILDYSPRSQAADATKPRILWLAGFAADGVARVGVLDISGNVTWAQVVDNVYASNDVPDTPASAIVAEDAAGKVVYTHNLGSSQPYTTR